MESTSPTNPQSAAITYIAIQAPYPAGSSAWSTKPPATSTTSAHPCSSHCSPTHRTLAP